ncbi:MAG: rhomboid family intramembrane serine protease [Myxococcota bacterium]
MSTCPVCTFPLRSHQHGNVALELCRRCGGTFVSLADAHEAYGGLGSPDTWNAQELAPGRGTRALRCPRDAAAMKAYLVTSHTGEVVVDVCGQCGGLWLDALEGERLARIVAGGVAVPASPDEKPSLRSYFFQLFTGMPIEVWHPTRRRPVLIYMLLATLTGLFLLEAWVIAGSDDAGQAFAHQFGLIPRDYLAGLRPWTMLSHAFIHGGVAHLLGNLYFLYVFGDNVEDTLGRRRLVLLYTMALVAGGAAEIAMDPAGVVPRLGASGAVAGLMGAYLVLFPKVRVWVVLLFVRFKTPVLAYLTLWLLLQVAGASQGVPGVAWFAHLGGFAAGIATGVAYRRLGRDIVPARA